MSLLGSEIKVQLHLYILISPLEMLSVFSFSLDYCIVRFDFCSLIFGGNEEVLLFLTI